MLYKKALFPSVVAIFTLIAAIKAAVSIENRATKKWEDIMEMAFDSELGEKLNADYWTKDSIDALKERLEQLRIAGFTNSAAKRRAKNVILFLGDGYGVASITATRKFKEESTGQPFYKSKLTWDSFPFSGYSKTYGLDTVIAESAGTATAYLSGVKTRLGYIGVDASGDPTCNNVTKGRLESIAARAVRSGKTAGLVTTTSITDASPAGLYANIPAPLRSWRYASEEFNFSMTHPNCEDIAKQFVKKGHFLKVVLGGGRGEFTPNTVAPEGDYNKRGLRNDGRNLIKDWKTDRWKRRGTSKSVYLTNRDELLGLDEKSVDYLLGLFNYGHMTFLDDNPPSSEPTLTEMTKKAIQILSHNNSNGFFLFVEGGRIDHGHHLGSARYALTEAIEFDKAVKAAVEMTDPRETLIVVTADHSHTLSISGFLPHNSSILGTSIEKADDDKHYTALLYANGPGAYMKAADGTRRNDTKQKSLSRGYVQQALVPFGMELHGGEDVPVYANGIHAELFSGVFEQSYIPWAIGCAAGIYHGPTPGTMVPELRRLCPNDPEPGWE